MRLNPAAAIGIALAVFACSDSSTGTPQQLVDNRLVAFVSDSDNLGGGTSIFVMHVDGTHKTRLTSPRFQDNLPAWSPDGSLIAFTTNRAPNGIWVMNADGSNLRPLLTFPVFVRADEPTWSPDGRSIAFIQSGAPPDYPLVIMVADSDGSHARRLTSNPLGELFPSWSPDGNKIAFAASTDSTGMHIFTINADGSGQHRLTTGFDEQPRFSPDGTHIAFINLEDSYHPQIFTMRTNGSDRRALTSNGLFVSPAWSSDGRQILYDGVEGEETSSTPERIFRISADGSDARAITSDGSDLNSASDSWSPAWKPAP